MKAKEVQKLKQSGKSEFQIYESLAGSLNLYGAAFYGHRCKANERRRLRYHWLTILRVFYPGYFYPGTLRIQRKYKSKKINI